MNEINVFSKVLYPIIFEANPKGSVQRIILTLKSNFEPAEMILLLESIHSKRLSGKHDLRLTLGLVASEQELQEYLDELSIKLSETIP